MENCSEPLGNTYKQLRQGLLSYLTRRLPNDVQVEDLLQDVFLKAVTTLRAEKPIDNMTGWLYTTARTTLVDYYRANKQHLQELDFDIAIEEEEDFTQHQELANCLRPFIEELPAAYRDTLIATELQEKKLQVLADEQGVSLSAIKSRAARGRSMLKDKLLDCCQVEIRNGLVDDYSRKPSGSSCC